MSDFFFSINVTFPIFLVIVIGWVLHQIGMLDEHFVTVANRFNFTVTLPFILFRDIARVDIWEVFDLKFVLFCAIVSTICFWSIWGLTKVFLKDKSMRGAFVLKKYNSEDIYVIGGEKIYEQLLDECDVAHITKIDYAYDADAHFTNLDEKPEWGVTADSEEQTNMDLEF